MGPLDPTSCDVHSYRTAQVVRPFCAFNLLNDPACRTAQVVRPSNPPRRAAPVSPHVGPGEVEGGIVHRAPIHTRRPPARQQPPRVGMAPGVHQRWTSLRQAIPWQLLHRKYVVSRWSSEPDGRIIIFATNGLATQKTLWTPNCFSLFTCGQLGLTG